MCQSEKSTCSSGMFGGIVERWDETKKLKHFPVTPGRVRTVARLPVAF